MLGDFVYKGNKYCLGTYYLYSTATLIELILFWSPWLDTYIGWLIFVMSLFFSAIPVKEQQFMAPKTP